MLIGGSSVKKFWMLLVMLTLFMTMGMTVQAKDQGDNEQSANVFDLLGEEFSERGTDVVAWLSEELGKEENAKLLKQLGIVVYLKAEVDTLVERLKEDTTRPLLKEGDLREKIETMLAVRNPIYEKAADVILETDAMSIYETIHCLEQL